MPDKRLGETMFRLASERYFETGGTGIPDPVQSYRIRHDPVMYAVLRNADQDQLAIYRIDTEISNESSEQRLSEPRWPEPNYELDPHDHIHALGAISANYTLLENTVGMFFLLYTGLPVQTAENLFSKMSNELRINTIWDGLFESDVSDDAKESTNYFLKGFMRIFNARNILMHAQARRGSFFDDLPDMLNYPTDPLEVPIELYKASKKYPAESILYLPTLRELRSIADSAHAFRKYGFDLFMHIAFQFKFDFIKQIIEKHVKEEMPIWFTDFIVRTTQTLPGKPPLPVPLNPHSPETPTK